jgi:hypothetical protein
MPAPPSRTTRPGQPVLSRRSLLLAGGPLFAVLFLGGLAWAGRPASRDEQRDWLRWNAYWRSTRYIRNRLKCSKQARFPTMAEANVKYLGDNLYEVSAHVVDEGERIDWTALLRWIDGDDHFHLEDWSPRRQSRRSRTGRRGSAPPRDR